MYYEFLTAMYIGAWYPVIIGSIVAFAIEHNAVWSMYEQMQKKNGKPLNAIHPVIIRMVYVAAGTLVVNLSYGLVTAITYWFPMHEPSRLSAVWDGRLYVLAIALIIMSGYALSLSAGTKWLIGVSKILATLGVLTAMALVIGSYIA